MSTVLAALNAALHQAMAANPHVYMIGEDLLDPYGGAFKVTRGLSDAFPDRVLPTPISEAGMVGLAGGMALRGLRPVVEIMFGDFTTLIADQLINSLTKFDWMYNGQTSVPLVIRTPMGGRRGYGPTHSQTLEKLFLGVPGLRVLAPAALGDPGQLLADAILDNQQPVLFIENKLLYLQKVNDPKVLADFQVETLTNSEQTPSYRLTISGAPAPTLTMLAYGYMAEIARAAAHQLAFQHEVFCEVLVPTQLAPMPTEPSLPATLQQALQRTGRLLVIEEGTLTMGWGAEMLARATETLGPALKAARRVAAPDQPIPAALPLEKAMLPDVEQIVQAALALN